MPKRKREGAGPYFDNNDGEDSTIRGKSTQLQGALENGQKTLFRALKVARGFERQKLGRRQKQAKEKQVGEEMSRLDAEVKALKGLDLPATAELHLYKTLAKTKSIASSPAFPAAYIAAKVGVSDHTPTVAYANVTARLYNSNPVRVAMSEVVDTIRGCLGLEKTPSKPKKRLRAADYNANGSHEKLEPNNTATGSTILDDARENSLPSELEGSTDKVMSTGGKSIKEDADFDESDDYKQHESRLANSSDQSSSDGEDSTRPIKERRQESFSPSPSISSSPDETPQKSTKAAKPTPATKSTTFLPSLTMGGYWSNSDSVPSDSESGVADIKPRKNRRGQQARRQLWEKKFGQKANHLKKQSRDQGWDAKKGAQGDDQRGSRGRGRGRGGRGRDRVSGRPVRVQGASGANSDPIGERRGKKTDGKASAGPLHPSWEAAKRKKEEKKTAAFEGTKTVFD